MKLDLTETEIIHIMDSLRMRIDDLRLEVSQWGGEETADLADELEELEHDLFEASARPDNWADELEPTEIAEDDFVQAGIEAREQQKASSRAADRRTMRFGEFQVQDTEIATTLANDPVDW